MKPVKGFLALALAALAAGGAPPAVDFVALRSHAGNANFDSFGFQSSCRGDFNGDGYADLAAYEADYSSGTPYDQGVVRVFSGRDGSELFMVRGPAEDAHYGEHGLTFVKDLDGDGCDEIAVACPRDATHGNWSGRVDVISGKTRLKLFQFYGATAGEEVGDAMAAAGDVDADGKEDLLVLAPGVMKDGVRTGCLRVYSGADGSVIHTIYGVRDDGFVAAAGDVDADGFADFILSNLADPTKGTYAGAAWVYSGLDASLLYFLTADDDHDYFGCSVAGIGDVDGDGCDDFAVGAEGDEENGVVKGAVHVYSGKTGTRVKSLYGDAEKDSFGHAIAALGDVDLDCCPDLAVGARMNDAAGEYAGQVKVFSGADWSTRITLLGSGTNMLFGSSLAGGGDMNGDSIPDLAVHSEGYGYPDKARLGKVDVYVSSCPDGYVAIDEGADYTGDTDVSLWLIRPDASWTEARARNEGGAWRDWAPFASRMPFTLTDGEGVKAVEAEIRKGGVVIGPIVDDIYLDQTPPEGTVAIDGGRGYTRQRGVTLSLPATDARAGVGTMRLRNDAGSFGFWRPYAATRAWVIGEAEGLHTVEVQYRDLVGNVSMNCSATVNLDTIAPTGTCRLNGGRGYVLPDEDVYLDVEAGDGAGGSGLDGLGVSFDDGVHWSSWYPFEESGRVDLAPAGVMGARVVRTRARDKAANDTELGVEEVYFLGPTLPVLGPLAKRTGPVAPEVRVQGYSVGLLAGDLFSAKVKTKGEGGADCGVEVDLLSPDGTRLVTGRYPAGLKAPGIAAFPVPATGEYSLVLRAVHGSATPEGTYALALSVKQAKENRGRAGTITGEPLLLDAISGSLLTASLKGDGLTAAQVTLSGPSGAIALPAGEGIGAVAIRSLALGKGTGTYRLEVSHPGPVTFKLALKLPK